MSDFIDLIERHFEGSLNKKEKEQFRRRLKEDPAFKKAYELEKDLMEGIEAMGNQDLKEELSEIYKEEILGVKPTEKPQVLKPENQNPESQTSNHTLISRRWLLIAAAAVAVLVIAYFIIPPSSERPEQLYASYFQPEFDFVEKGDNEVLIAEAQAALKDNRFEKALPLLDQLIQQKPDFAEYYLAKGIALIEIGKFTEGRQFIDQSQAYNPNYKSSAFWYNALSFLKQGNLDECIERLEKIPNDSSFYESATELVKKVNAIKQ